VSPLLADYASGSANSRPKVDLNGTWKFATDPDEIGEKQEWFKANSEWLDMPLEGYAKSARGKIEVPGSWAAQGYGAPNDGRFHQFEGVAWYRRDVRVPSNWEGQSVYLYIGGVHRQAKIWINGELVDEHIGYMSEINLNLNGVVSPGETCHIVIQVDSRHHKEVDPFRGTIDGIEVPGGSWGGIWGHVRLEARSDVYLSEPWVETLSIDPPRIRVSATLDGHLPYRADAASVVIVDAEGEEVAQLPVALTRDAVRLARFETEIPLGNAKLWSPEEPNLYTARIAVLRDEKTLDEITQRFGVRELEIDGQYFVLNGRRVFLSGAGDDNVYPDDFGALFVPKEKLLRRAKLMKSYGFNAVRTHTSIMSPEYYDVCDEVGLLVRAELPLGPHEFKSMMEQPAARMTLEREFAAAIKRHRSHPSIYSWSMGNEHRAGRHSEVIAVARDLKSILNLLQPDSYFIDGANSGYYRPVNGVNLHYNVVEEFARDTLDYSSPINYSYGHPYKIEGPAEMGGIVFDQSVNPFPKPGIIHESGEFVTFPDLDDRHLFKVNMKPFWLDDMVEGYGKLGLLDENDVWTEVSEKLYMSSHKLEMENLRLQDAHAGYDLWLFQDYWNTSNGVTNHYLKPKKGVSQEDFARFNNSDTVLLKEGLNLTYRGGDTVEMALSVWHYGAMPIESGEYTYEVNLDGDTLAQGRLSGISAEQGDVTSLKNVRLVLPNVSEPAGLQISAKLKVDDKTYDNFWSANIFPRARAAVRLSRPVFATSALVESFAHHGARSLPQSVRLSPDAIYLVNRLEKRVIDALEAGAFVVLVHPEDHVLPFYDKVRWRSGYWSGRTPYKAVGQLLYDHPLNRAITVDNWFSHEWWYLFEGARTFFLDKLPEQLDPIIRTIDGPPVVFDKALVFEARVGKGYLLASGLNHVNATDRPEVQWVTDQMLNYLASDPSPRNELSANWLRERLTALASAPKSKK